MPCDMARSTWLILELTLHPNWQLCLVRISAIIIRTGLKVFKPRGEVLVTHYQFSRPDDLCRSPNPDGANWPGPLRINQPAISASGQRSRFRHPNRLAWTKDSAVRDDTHRKIQHHKNYPESHLRLTLGRLWMPSVSGNLCSIPMANTQTRTSKMRPPETTQTRSRMFGDALLRTATGVSRRRCDIWDFPPPKRPESQPHVAEFLY